MLQEPMAKLPVPFVSYMSGMPKQWLNSWQAVPMPSRLVPELPMRSAVQAYVLTFTPSRRTE